MYCNICGNNVPDGATHCNICGAAMTPAQPASGSAPTPGYAPAPSHASSHKMKKSEYLKSYADPATKKLGLIAWVVAAACLLVLFLSMNATLNGSLFDISVVGLVMEAADEDLEDELDDLIDDTLVELEWMEAKGDLSRSEFKEAKAVLKDLEDNFSINNFKKLAKVYADANPDDDIEVILDVINVLSTAAVIFTLICAGLLALGAVYRAGGWVIASMILALLYSLSFSTFLFVVLIAVSFIALTVILSKINKAYFTFLKAY